MAASTTLTINNKVYTFDKNGVMQESTISGDSLASDKLIEFIKGWELFKPHAYRDVLHPSVQAFWTIGYGTTYQVNPSAFPNGLDSTCTKEQANQWLLDELIPVAKLIKSKLDAQGASIS